MTAKIFTRDDPCTKIDLHNCFYRNMRYAAVPVVEAQSIIGKNAPKYLLREELIVLRSTKGVDFYVPTAKGDAWLRAGILRFLELHPERASECKSRPLGYMAEAPRKKVVAKPAPAAPARRIIRRR